MATEPRPEADLLIAFDAPDWRDVRDAVETAADCLRLRRLAEPLRSRLIGRIIPLASHSKWEVRKAVAHALLFVPQDAFQPAIGRLLADDNAWVRDAAQRTLRRRSQMHRNTPGEERGDGAEALLATVERRWGSSVRRAVLRLADLYHARFVREAWHELIKVITPLDAALMTLEREWDPAATGRSGRPPWPGLGTGHAC